jgi:hypothetical protein
MCRYSVVVGFLEGNLWLLSCWDFRVGVAILLFLFVDFAAGCVFGEHPKGFEEDWSDDLMLAVDLMENGSDQ